MQTDEIFASMEINMNSLFSQFAETTEYKNKGLNEDLSPLRPVVRRQSCHLRASFNC